MSSSDSSPSRGSDHTEDRKRRRSESRSPERNGHAAGDQQNDAPKRARVGEGGPSDRQTGPAVNGHAAGQAGPLVAVENGDGGPRKAVNLGKAGGVYVPPFKLARMLQEVKDRSSPEYQKLTWEALKKSINGIVNKVNTVNIKHMLVEVFRENLIRGRGLFCRSMMKSQLASPTFSPVYAALTAVVNTKFPELGELLLHRLCLQFMRSYKRNDKAVCTAAAKFLAHLINQGVAHEVLALEMLILMLEKPSADSVEMACVFTKEVGAYLEEITPQGLHSVFERFRAILHDGSIDKRVQFVIEGLFAVRRAGFAESGYMPVKKELDLVEAEDQITHEISLDDPHDPQVGLDLFKVDPEYEKHEREFKAISREILGQEESSSEGEEGDGEGDGEEDEEEDSEELAAAAQRKAEADAIEDQTQTNLVNLRRTIYLTIQSSMQFEEAGHKLMKIGIQPGQEVIMAEMIIECCAQERTYKKFYGNLAERFCHIKREYQEAFEAKFREQYETIHRLETNKLRNEASLFAHLLVTDALAWSVLDCMRLTEEDTTSSSRIFIKYLFQDMSSSLGVLKLAERLNDPTCQQWYDGIFPKDTQANLRFAINFFTSIGLGGLTDKMREFYKQMPALAAERARVEQEAAQKAAARYRALHGGDTTSDSDSSSSDSDSDSSDSDSDSSDSSGSSDSDSSSSSSSSDSDDDRRRRHRRRDARIKTADTKGTSKGGRAPPALAPPPPLPPPRDRGEGDRGRGDRDRSERDRRDRSGRDDRDEGRREGGRDVRTRDREEAGRSSRRDRDGPDDRLNSAGSRGGREQPGGRRRDASRSPGGAERDRRRGDDRGRPSREESSRQRRSRGSRSRS